MWRKTANRPRLKWQTSETKEEGNLSNISTREQIRDHSETGASILIVMERDTEPCIEVTEILHGMH